MPLEKSEPSSLLAAAGVVRESWTGKLQPAVARGDAFGAVRRLAQPRATRGEAGGMQGRVGARRVLGLAGSVLQRAGANTPGTALVFTSEFGFLLS